MSRTLFEITDEKLRKFVEDAQDLLDNEPGSHLTLHRIADDRSEKKIARYDNEEDWADTWLEATVSSLLETEGHARLRLRRWLKGGRGKGSHAFEVGEVSAPRIDKPPTEAAPVPMPPVSTPAPLPTPAPPLIEPSPLPAANDARMAGLEAQILRISAAVSGVQSQPPDYRLAMATERAQATAQQAQVNAQQAQSSAQQAQRVAGEVQSRQERSEGLLRSTQAENQTLKAEVVSLKEEKAAVQKRLDLLEEKLVMVHGLVEDTVQAIVTISKSFG